MLLFLCLVFNIIINHFFSIFIIYYMNVYYEKYIKYKEKYLQLKNSNNILVGGETETN